MATRRRYTKREKASAVMAAIASNTTAAAEQTGIPRTTIEYWLERPEFVELRQKTQEERADGMRTLALLAMDRLSALIPTMEPRDLIVLMGVATEKGQLLGGQATERTEHRDITDGLDDHERAALNEAIRAELARRADTRSAVDAVGPAGETGAEAPAG